MEAFGRARLRQDLNNMQFVRIFANSGSIDAVSETENLTVSNAAFPKIGLKYCFPECINDG